jgi:hypothetical protein
MLRAIAAVIAGYLAMAIAVFVTLTLAWVALGPGFAFKAGTTEVTFGWIAINLPLSFVCALLGGWVAAKIARRPGPVKALAAVILVLGLGMAVAHLFVDSSAASEEAADRVTQEEEVSTFEAASEAIQPPWYNFLLPFLGAAGVLLGGRQAGARASSAQT